MRIIAVISIQGPLSTHKDMYFCKKKKKKKKLNLR